MKMLRITVLLLVALIGILFWPAKKSLPDVPPLFPNNLILMGAGDIADGDTFANLPNAAATANLIDSYVSPNTVFVFADGDLAYENGTDGDFAKAYGLTWGRIRRKTLFPVLGNHEYNALNAAGYFNYFGPAADDPTKGYYSMDLRTWHIVVLNSECSNVLGGCGAGSPQEVWLKNDLAANTQGCTLALWHEPRYTSSSGGINPNSDVQPLWADLYNYDAELVVNGHAHNYERFAPQNPNGISDSVRGLTEVVAGTGGGALFPFNSTIAANSLVRNNDTHGVLQLTLGTASFDWQFMPIAGQTFTDSGTKACHVPAVTLNPPSLSFTSAGTQTVTLYNVFAFPFSSGPYHQMLSISRILTSNGAFSQTNNCGSWLFAGHSCTINVTYTPPPSLPACGTLVLFDDADNNPQFVNLSGGGTCSGGVPRF